MRIAIVSKSNGSIGGASYFAECLTAWLIEQRISVTQFCLEPAAELRPFQCRITPRTPIGRLQRHLNWRLRRLGLLEPFAWDFHGTLRSALVAFDVVHFHDLHLAISPRTLALAARRKPVVFTVHDCSAFTGGCLFPLECTRFRTGCGTCPRFQEIGHFDFTRRNQHQVRGIARSRQLHYVFPSRWIQADAESVLEISSRSHHIANGFDPRSYAMPPRSAARQQLGIAPGERVVALSAASLKDPRKGGIFGVRALDAVRDLKPRVILIGHASPELDRVLGDVNCLRMGFVTDRRQLGRLYAAADLLLFPSLGDNLPITIQEAMAAATPVLAFAVGGVPELVRPDVTGWLVPVGDQEALNRTLREVLLGGEAAAFGRRARSVIEEEFSVAHCVARHLALYERICAPGTTRANP